MGLILWIQKKLTIDGLSPQAALQYTYNVAAAVNRMGKGAMDNSQLLHDFRRSLRRGGAMTPLKQAQPATRAEVAKVLSLEHIPLMKLAISLAWGGCARASDVFRLRAEEVSIFPNHIQIHWVETKSDPFKLGRWTGVVIDADMTDILRHRLKALESNPKALLFHPLGYHQMYRAMKRADQNLTPHSLRRGAIETLNQNNVPLEDIRQLSRHSSVDCLVRYLSTGGAQRVRGTAQTSALLK